MNLMHVFQLKTKIRKLISDISVCRSMSDLIKLLLTLLMAIVIAYVSKHYWFGTVENFEPIRYIPPDLYPTTGPVDMVSMRKFLIRNGYRFQNAMFAPVPVNSDLGLAESDRYPNSYRQLTGVFKEKMFVEKTPQPQVQFKIAEVKETFADGGIAGTGLSASPATIGQLNSSGGPDRYLMSIDGEPSHDRPRDSPFALLAKPPRESEINYKNALFSWGDVIHRFYNPSHHRYTEGIVI